MSAACWGYYLIIYIYKIDSGVRLGCIMSLWLFNVYMDGVMEEVKMGIGKEGSELPGG